MERSSPDRPLAPDPTPALARIAPPEGVDAALWQQLKAALREALAINLPPGPQEVRDLAISVTGTQATGATAQFTWTYVNGGDYDQNGEVNIGDLTPLGLHFGKTQQSADWAAAQMADGDGNGEINIADVTPIGVNYGGAVQGYVLQVAPSGGAGAPWQDVAGATRLLADGSLPPGGGAISLSLSHSDPIDGMHYRVQPYSGTARGVGSNDVIADVPPAPQNQPPLALLGLNPQGGSTPASIFFSGASSSDDGGIVKYEWDLDGDGEFEYDSGSDPNARYIYFEPGSYTVTLRVSDAQGLSDTTAKLVNVSLGASWHMKPVAETIAVDEGIDLAMQEVNGRPAMAYRVRSDSGGNRVDYILGADSHASGWTAPLEIAGEYPGLSLPINLCLVAGRPTILAAVTQTWSSMGVLCLAANDPLGTSWPDAGAVFGLDSMEKRRLDTALVGVRPCVAALSPLRFYHALDDLGQAWSEPVVVDETLSNGQLSLNTIGGRPAVAYHDYDSGYLKYAYAADAGLSGWSIPLQIASVGDVGAAPILLDCGGQPGVAYYDDTAKALRFTRSEDLSGVSWTVPLVIAADASPLLAAVDWNGTSFVAYWQRNSYRIMAVCACNSGGSNWTTPIEIADNAVPLEDLVKPIDEIQAGLAGGLPCVGYTTWVDPPGVGDDSQDLWISLYY